MKLDRIDLVLLSFIGAGVLFLVIAITWHVATGKPWCGENGW